MNGAVARTVALCGAMSLLSGDALAACSSLACDDEYIEQLRVEDNGNVYVTTSGDEALLNCTLYSGYITLSASIAGTDRIYAALLSAKNQNARMGRIRIVEGSSGCQVKYVW